MSRILDHRGNPFNGQLPPIQGGEAGARAVRSGAYDDFALPTALSFSALYQTGYRSFWHGAGDEALRFDRESALAMRRDSALMGMYNERRLAFTSLNWHLETPDEKDPTQIEVRDTLTKALRQVRGLRRIIWGLSDCIWYGRSAVQWLWQWANIDGQRILSPRKWRPINGDKISYMFDGTPCIAVFGAVNSEKRTGKATLTAQEQEQWAKAMGEFSLANAHFVWTMWGKALVLDGTWRERFCISQHELDDRDFQNGEEAEAVFGRGIRDVLFALDYMKREWLSNIADYFERVGQGITLWYWDAGNPASKAEVESAARDQSDRVNLLVPRYPNNKGNNQPGLERIEVPVQGSQFLLELIRLIDEYQERYINGQTLSHESGGGGFGGSIADFHSETKNKVAAQDAINSQEDITGDKENPGLVSMMKDWSFPGKGYDFPVWFKYDLQEGQSKEKLEAIKTLVEMRVPTKAAEARAMAGTSKPGQGDELIPMAAEEGAEGAPGDDQVFSNQPDKLFASPEEKAGMPEAGHQAAVDALGTPPAAPAPEPSSGDIHIHHSHQEPREDPGSVFEWIAARHGPKEAMSLLAHAIKEKQLPLEGSSAGAHLRPMEGTTAFAKMPLMTLLQLQRELGLSRYAAEEPKAPEPSPPAPMPKVPVPHVRDVDLRQFMKMEDAYSGDALDQYAVWDESKHKRGQPKNAGQFGPGGGGAGKKSSGGIKPVKPVQAVKPIVPPTAAEQRMAELLAKHGGEYSLLDSLLQEPPKGQQRPEAKAAVSSHREGVNNILGKSLAQSNLPPALKAKFAKAAHDVLDRMPDGALSKIANDLGNIDFSASIKDLSTKISRLYPKELGPNEMVGGMCVPGNVPGQNGKASLYLDGENANHDHGADPKHTYAHEFGHVLDNNCEISNSEEWNDAWNSEIADGALSNYGATVPVEGFAEFSRLLYMGDMHLDEIVVKFPKASAIMKSRGFWPEN